MSKLWLLFFLATACQAERRPPAPAVQKYLEEVTEILQANFINRKAVDWEAFRQNLWARAGGATTIAQAYPAVAAAIGALGDQHTAFVPPGAVPGPGSPAGPPLRVAADEPVPADIGYLRIAWVVGGPDQLADYLARVQAEIRVRDKPGLKGWLVDLRGNMGGNMWPMLAAVGPILGEETVGYYVDANNGKTAWRYARGRALADGDIEAETAPYYTLRVARPVVAVLTDTLTASSGEAVAVAFKGRPHTRSFGAGTCGVSTSRSRFPLSDGAVLLLSTAVFADRRQVRYGHSIAPDERLPPAEAVPRAIRWIRAEYGARR